MATSTQQMLQEFLVGLGFTAMARDVATECDLRRLQHYARVILRALPIAQRQAVYSRFAMLRLV
jgi:hypothetical protein